MRKRLAVAGRLNDTHLRSLPGIAHEIARLRTIPAVELDERCTEKQHPATTLRQAFR